VAEAAAVMSSTDLEADSATEVAMLFCQCLVINGTSMYTCARSSGTRITPPSCNSPPPSRLFLRLAGEGGYGLSSRVPEPRPPGAQCFAVPSCFQLCF